MVYDPDLPEVFSTAEQVRNEFVVRVRSAMRRAPRVPSTGTVDRRDRVLGQELEILNRAETPPFNLTTTTPPKSCGCAAAASICAAR